MLIVAFVIPRSLLQPMYSANGDDYIVGDVIGEYALLCAQHLAE